VRPLSTDSRPAAPVNGPDFSRFGAVDKEARPEEFVRFLDGISAADSFRRLKMTMLKRMELAPGDRVLDVGCGVGGDVLDVAAMVGPAGVAVGVDVSEAMVREARRRAAAARRRAEFYVGDATNLPFPSGWFDAVRTERTLVHLHDADGFLGCSARPGSPTFR
jgi:ubiquinone/menaquinone biosynthesis C-methylase UbiE